MFDRGGLFVDIGKRGGCSRGSSAAFGTDPYTLIDTPTQMTFDNLTRFCRR